MGATQKLFSQFTFREYLAWTSEEESDEFIELDQFAATIYNNLNIPWNESIEAISDHIVKNASQFGEYGEEMLMELYEEYLEMMKNPEEDEMYVIETLAGEIISVYTRD